MADRPADECPYPKPFPDDFAECPTYQAQFFVPLDTSYRPLQPVWSCRHLKVRSASQRPHRFYAACALGDPAARHRWAQEVRTERLDQIAALRQRFADITEPYSQRLWAAKAGQLRALESHEDPARASRELEAVGHEFLADMAIALRANEATLHQLGFPLDACLALIEAWLSDWAAQPSSVFAWEVPDDLVSRFPQHVRVFFRPQDLTPRPTPASPAA